MQQWLSLPVLVLIPLLGGFAMALMPRDRHGTVRVSALVISLIVFAINVVQACAMFDWGGAGTQLECDRTWIEPFGVSLSFGVDQISMLLVLLATFLMPLTILSSFRSVNDRVREFYMWLLVLEAAMIGVFISTDLILFYICFEATLVPLYFLIGIYGSGRKRWAAHKFFLFTFTGSVFTFAGVLYVAWFAASQPPHQWTFNIGILTAAAQQMSLTEQSWVLLALIAGFAVKVPLFPVHTWLPLAHTEAPTAGSVVLAGVLLKLGTYGLLRFALPMTPDAVLQYAPLIAIFAIVGILYAALICWVQTDIKKLVAYSSISHLGFCVLGMFALNTVGVGGSVMYMINHGLSTGALFLCVGMIYERYHTRDMDSLSGLGKRLPIWSTFMVFFCLASVGLPGLNGFVGEFLTLLGAFTARHVLGIPFAVAAGFGMILAAIYILYMVGKVIMGPVKEPAEYAGKVRDLNVREIVTLAPIAVMCLVLGVLPGPVLRSLEPAIDQVLTPQRTIVVEMDSPQELVQRPPAQEVAP